MAKCKAKTRTGKPCRMRPLKGSDFCFNHSPEAAAQRAAARKRGGEARHNERAGDPAAIPQQINSIQDARRILDFVKDELLVLDNTIARNRALIALHDSIAKSIEIGELEERLKALEERFNAKTL
jgi:hypothetical protein